MSQLIDLGKLRFHFAGDWLSSTTYESNDIVKYGGNIYVYTYALKTSGNLPTNSAYWELMVEGFKFTGTFNPSTQYKVGDGIAYGGKVYIAILDSTGQVPPNSTYWSQFVDGIQYEGPYSAITSYQRNDVVVYGGSIYIAKVDTTGNLPTNNTFWEKFVEGISPKSVYNAATTYKPNDLVAYGPNIYRALKDTTGNVPTDTTNWEIFVSSIKYQGNYSNATTYYLNDIVLYGSNTYRSKQTQAGTLPTNVASWELLTTGFSFKGAWTSSTQYKIAEVVGYGGSLYQALADNQNVNPTVQATWNKLISGFKNRGTWSTATQYETDEVVAHGGNTYISLLPHASTDFELDLDAGKWQKFNSGVRWKNAWVANTQYLKDDVIKEALGSTYIATQDHVSSVDFALDRDSAKWELFVAGAGDVLPAATPTDGGRSLTLSPTGSTLDWIGATESENVYYVAPHGVDQITSGKNLASPFASIKYATQHCGPNATIFVKTGTYSEQLPIVVPEHTAIVGDSQRTVIVQPKSGLSDDGSTPNANASMFLMSNGSILNKMTFKGMTGWVPGSTPDDITTSTIRGVVVRFNPDSPATTKSPYVLECAFIGSGAIGALIDGTVHTSGAKTMIFHGYTVITDNGVGYWVKDGGKAEIVSCFTYYAYFGYTASGGGFIRALNGNNSYGTWGATSRGFDSTETPSSASLIGKQLNFVYQGGNINVGDTVTSSSGATAVVLNVQTTSNKVYVSDYTGTFSLGDTVTFTGGGTGTVSAGALENQRGFVLILTGFTSTPKPGASISLADDTISYVIQSVSGTYVDASSKLVVVLAQEKPTGSAPGTIATIRYKYSQVRLTGHDFLSIGTGGTATTNYPGTPTQPPAQGNETDEAYPGRVYYVSTDQDGNFRVGEYFRIDQATGRATLNASAFDLAGLTSLRLGSIGAQLGETINEFSSDGTLSGNSNVAVPTEQAVKTYVDDLHAATFEPTGFNRGMPLSMGCMEFSLDGVIVHKIDHLSNYTVRTDGKFATGTVWERSAAGNTFVFYPAAGQAAVIVWQAGIKYTFNSLQTVTVTGQLAGTTYFFVDQGNLVSYASISGDYIQKQAFLSLVYVNNNTNEVVLFADERHGITMDGATHYYLHTTSGTRFKSGLTVAGVEAGGTSFTSLAAGELWDEDILITIPSVAAAPMLYRNADSWSKYTSASTFSHFGEGSVAKYNRKLSPGLYDVVDIPADSYAVMYLMATNDRISPYVRLMGQYVFTDLAKARESAQTEPRDTVTAGIPVTEFLWVGAVVVDSTGTIQVLDNADVYVDLRYVNISSGTNSSAAVQATAVDTYYNNQETGLKTNNVQAAIDLLKGEFLFNQYISLVL